MIFLFYIKRTVLRVALLKYIFVSLSKQRKNIKDLPVATCMGNSCSPGCFVLSFVPLDVLDEIWDVIESVSEGFVTYSCNEYIKFPTASPI